MAFHFGKKVIQYRQKNHLTIQELANRTNLSNAVISQIERGLGNPTYSVLQAIANEMGVSVSNLVQEEIKNADLVLRKEEWRILYDYEKDFVMYGLLTANPVHNNIELVCMKLAPHHDTPGGFWIHPEEECLYVMSGEIRVEFEEEMIFLHEGDTIRILPGRKHLLHNDGSRMACLINVKCRASY